MFRRAGEGGAEGCFGSSCAAEQIELTWGAEVRGEAVQGHVSAAAARVGALSTGGSGECWRKNEHGGAFLIRPAN